MSKYVPKEVNNHCMYLDAFIYSGSVFIVLYFQSVPPNLSLSKLL